MLCAIRTQSTLMSGAKFFHRLTESLWTAPSWETMRGTITTFETLFSRVSRVARSLYLSFFSLKALLVHVVSRRYFHVDDHLSIVASRVMTEPHQVGLQLWSCHIPSPFHPSDLGRSVPTVISSRLVRAILMSSHFCSWSISPLSTRMLLRDVHDDVMKGLDPGAFHFAAARDVF